MDTRLKQEAEAVFKSMGLDAATAVRMFYTKVVNTRSIPFPVQTDDVRLEGMLLEGLDSPASPLEEDWSSSMKLRLKERLATAHA